MSKKGRKQRRFPTIAAGHPQHRTRGLGGQPVAARGKYSRAAQQRLMEKLEGSRTQSLWQKMKAAAHWDDKSPERKAGMVLRVCLVLLLVTWGSLLLNMNLASRGYGTMASFLIYGDWTRGANPFAVCSVAIVVDVVGFAID